MEQYEQTPSWSLLIFMSFESEMPSNHLILCCLLIPLPSVFPSIRVFSSESALCIRWPKYWSFTFLTWAAVLFFENIKDYRWYSTTSGPLRPWVLQHVFLQGYNHMCPFALPSCFSSPSSYHSASHPMFSSHAGFVLVPRSCQVLSYHRLFAHTMPFAKTANHHASSYSFFKF